MVDDAPNAAASAGRQPRAVVAPLPVQDIISPAGTAAISMVVAIMSGDAAAAGSTSSSSQTSPSASEGSVAAASSTYNAELSKIVHVQLRKSTLSATLIIRLHKSAYRRRDVAHGWMNIHEFVGYISSAAWPYQHDQAKSHSFVVGQSSTNSRYPSRDKLAVDDNGK